MSRVLTVGTFDLFHQGHVKFLYGCAKIAGKRWDKEMTEANAVIVGLNTDEFVEKYKGKKPIYSYDERRTLLINSRNVYDLYPNDQKDGTMRPLLEKLAPDILVIGSDWAKKDYYTQIGVSQEWLTRKGILLCYIPYTEGISTTELKERIIGS